MKKHYSYLFGSMALLGLVLAQPQRANAQNYGPPIGPQCDLAGSALPTGGYVSETCNFTATGSTTDLTFAFRNDPGFTELDDVSLFDNTASSAVAVQNPGFETGTLAPGWNYDNQYGSLPFEGVVATGANSCNGAGGPNSGNNFWCDGAVQGYDAIDQMIATITGDHYTVNFALAVIGSTQGDTVFQQLSTNGDTTDAFGNGIDTLVYTQGSTPVSGATPEPASMLLFGTGLAGLGLLSRRRARKQ